MDINFNKGKVMLPNGTVVRATTIARDLAKKLSQVAPIKKGGELIDYQSLLTTAYTLGCQNTGTVSGGVAGMKQEYIDILKAHKKLIRQQKLAELKGLKKLKFKVFGDGKKTNKKRINKMESGTKK